MLDQPPLPPLPTPDFRSIGTALQFFRYAGGTGPQLLIFTTAGQLGRPADRQARLLARRNHCPVWSIHVHSIPEFGHLPTSRVDIDLVDDGHVADDLYRSTDERCWILVDRSGRIAWQGGPAGLASLDLALSVQPRQAQRHQATAIAVPKPKQSPPSTTGSPLTPPDQLNKSQK
jgi:hypothetical protein